MQPAAAHVDRLARAGWLAKGALYGVIGLLALGIAVGAGAQDADQTGALRTIAAQPFGAVLVGLMAVGLAGYALWRLAQAVWPRHSASEALWRRGANLARAVLYAAMAVLAARVLLGSPTPSDAEPQVTAAVLSWPLGVPLVALGGLVVMGVGLYQGYVVASGGVRDQLAGEHRPTRRWLLPVGVAGFLARMVAFTLTGWFVLSAALAFDPERAQGLDGALQELAGGPGGRWAIGAVALGLLAYGGFCLALSRVGVMQEA